MSQRIVVALGGNALGKNLTEQYQAARETAKAIVDLIADGNQVVIAHGNGLQVGMIQTAMTELTRGPGEVHSLSLSVCVAMKPGATSGTICEGLAGYAVGAGNSQKPSPRF